MYLGMDEMREYHDFVVRGSLAARLVAAELELLGEDRGVAQVRSRVGEVREKGWLYPFSISDELVEELVDGFYVGRRAPYRTRGTGMLVTYVRTGFIGGSG